MKQHGLPMQSEPDDAVVAQAIAWLMRLSSGTADADEHAAYRCWRAEQPQHALAAERLERLFANFDTLAAAPAMAALDAVLKPPSRKRRPVVQGMLGVAASLVCGLVLYVAQPMTQVWLADYRSAAGERRSIELADHSHLTLNSDSAVDVQYSTDGRRVNLLRGEVLVEVAHIADPLAQPFIVTTGDGTARALGTRFLVRRDAGSTLVTVLESAVQASAAAPTAGGTAQRTVAAGQQVRVTAQAVGTLESIDVEQAEAWTRGRLVADNTPLPEVLAALVRYRHGAIRYDAEVLASVRVSGVFSLDDGERTLDALQSALPIKVQRYAGLLTVVSPR